MKIRGSKLMGWFAAVLLFAVYSITAPQNHSEAEDVYDFALHVEQGTFADQAGVNRVLALPLFGSAYRVAQTVGYSGRAFPFMIFINRILGVICVILFWKLLGSFSLSFRGRPACSGESSTVIADKAPPERSAVTALCCNHQSSTIYQQLIPVLCLAFSYGFWRYANEAETYILASIFVLGAWNLVLRGKEWWCVVVSTVGILVHLLNLIPLLLIIPLYYLLSGNWKKALFHGVLTGLMVIAGYSVCAPWLDFSGLGAQHHGLEGGLSISNLMRGGIAFGQNLLSANFLFGFESFRELLTIFFPSRMLDEEFYMASKMRHWIPWAGTATVVALLGVGVWVLMEALGSGRRAFGRLSVVDRPPNTKRPKPNAFYLSCAAWLFLYALAVIRTEAGSPELWIMALIPFWFLFAMILPGKDGEKRKTDGGDKLAHRANTTLRQVCGVASESRFLWVFVVLLFTHNLIGGLIPVLSKKSDYHAKKSAWLLENTSEDDLVLTSYEPILIFYLNYYCPAKLLNSSETSVEEITDELGKSKGNTYAFNSFFQPLESMGVRSPEMYERMVKTGMEFFPDFGIVESDEFGGIYELKAETEE